MSRINQLILSLYAGLFVFLVPLTKVSAQRPIGGCDVDDKVCQLGYNASSGTGNIISVIVQFIFVIAVILALGFLVYGGIKWLTSGGDKDAVASARSTIIAAIIGLIIIFLSYFILNFILLFLTGDGISTLQIPRIIGDSGGSGTSQE